VFRDAFSRMDQNDDEKIQLQEFAAFFEDDETPERLAELFRRIDTNGDGTLSPEELATFFSSGAGVASHAPLFRALFDLHSAASRSLQAASVTAHEGDADDRFRVRFCMREALFHLRSLAGTLNSASRALSDAVGTAVDTPPAAPRAPSTATVDVAHQLLELLQQQRVCWCQTAPKFRVAPRHGPVDADDDSDSSDEVFLTRSEMHIAPETDAAFREALRLYVEDMRENSDNGCLAAVVSRPHAGGCFVLHEAWRSKAASARHFTTSPAARAFRHACADMLISPTVASSVLIPKAWLEPS